MKLTLEAINQAIAVLFFVCYAYQFVYIPVALLRRRKRLPAAAPHRFAVLIAARNEETVIGDLLDSLHAQDYDMSLITVFVIADNCTDRTAAIASEKGAVVYTRQNKQAVGKGYALEALLAHIKSDYPDGYDAYLVFDADNLLAPDFLTRMNESFSAGNEIITCYRNSKNYGSNWISAGYALWFLRESRFLNGAGSAWQQLRRFRHRVPLFAEDPERMRRLAVPPAGGGYRIFHPQYSFRSPYRHLPGCRHLR